MANGTTSAASIQNTASIGLGTTGGLVIAEWLVAPSWPPPVPVLTIAVGMLTPIIHLVGRALYRKIAAWAGPETDEPAAPAAAVPAEPPPAPIPAPVPIAPVAPAPPPAPAPNVAPAAPQNPAPVVQ